MGCGGGMATEGGGDEDGMLGSLVIKKFLSKAACAGKYNRKSEFASFRRDWGENGGWKVAQERKKCSEFSLPLGAERGIVWM
jgi:hypothetical protein